MMENGKDSKSGKFLDGNHFWMNRSSHGAKRIMESAADLQEACCEYFAWATENPIVEDKTGFHEGTICRGKTYKHRAFSIMGLCRHIGISEPCWYQWRQKRKDLSQVIAWAENVIREQQFTLAAAGSIKENIVARMMGLTERHEVDNKSSDGSMSLSAFSDDVAKALAAAKGIEKDGA